MAIEMPDLKNPSGPTTFNPIRPRDPVTPTQQPRSVMDNLSGFFDSYQKYKQTPDENAFLEGASDKIADRVKEQSWLTKDSYNDGVNYQAYSEKESQAQAGLKAKADEVLKQGGDLDAYREATAPILQELRDSITDGNFGEKAKGLAMKKYIEFQAASLGTYQKRLELMTKQNNTAAVYKGYNTALAAAASSNFDPNAYVRNMHSQFEMALQNPTDKEDPIGSSSKTFVAAVEGGLSNANPATPEGQAILRANVALLNNPKTMEMLSTDSYAKLQTLVATGQKEAMDYTAMKMESNVLDLRRQIDTGQVSYTPGQFKGLYDDVLDKVNSGFIRFNDGMRVLNKIHEVEKEYNKDAVGANVAMMGTPAQRAAEWGIDGDKKAADLLLKKAAAQYGEDYTGTAGAMVSMGVKTMNPIAVTYGFKQLMPTVESMMLVKPEQFDKTVDQTSKSVWRNLVSTIQGFGGRDTPMKKAALNAFNDPATRDAVEAYLSTSPNAGQNVAFDMQEIQRYKEQVTGTGSGGGAAGTVAGVVGSGGFKAADLKSGFFASHLWPVIGDGGAGKPTSWWNNPSEGVIEQQARVLNGVWDQARPELAAMVAGGRVIGTPTQKIRALQDLGRIASIDTGIVPMTPTFRKGITVPLGEGGKEVQLNDADFQSMLEATRDQYVRRFKDTGGRQFKAEDVRLTAVGNQLLISAVDADGKPVAELQRWGISHMRDVAYSMFKNRDGQLGQQNMLTISQGGKNAQRLNVTKDWYDTFGADLAPKLAGSFLRYEGTVDGNQATDKNRPGVITTGIGIRTDTPDRAQWKAKLDNARSKGREYFDAVQGQFVKEYFKNFKQDVKNADLPDMSTNSVTGLTPAYAALAHAKWQAGDKGADQMANILKVAQRDPAQAETLFKQSRMYTEITQKFGGKDNHPRLQMYREGIQAVSQSTGAGRILAAKAMRQSGIDAFTKPTYPVFTDLHGGQAPRPVFPYTKEDARTTGKIVQGAKDAVTKPSYSFDN